jgi:hypothetical protein
MAGHKTTPTACRRAMEDREMSDNTFDTATYYDTGDGDDLSHETPEDAIEALLDEARDIDEPFSDVIARLAPVTVHAYNRMPVSDKQRKMIAEHALEDMREELSEYGEPGGNHIIELVDEPLAIMRKAIDEILDEHATIWACEEVASRVYRADEIKEILR